ncbi:MAG TPA: ABC transporter transmembrane domain-containing protein [Puia sp.]|nr:ABC transporter transmembrane domain-containing protein [Puia sp.]
MANSRFRNEAGSSAAPPPKVKINKTTLRESLLIFRYVSPYRWQFAAGLLFIGLSSLSTMAFPYLLKLLIDSAGRGAGHYTPGFLALAMVGVLSIQMVFSYLRVYLFTSVGEHALADMRTDVYRRIIRMPMDFFAQRRVGELSSRISADLSQIQDVVTSVLAEILRGLLTLLIGLGLIFYISPRLSLMMLSVVPLVVVLAIVFGKRIRKISRQTQDQLADSNTIVQETLQGIGNVKAFSNEWYEIKRYAHSLREAVLLAVKNGRNRGLFVSFLIFTLFGTIILVVWYGVGLMQAGVLSFGALTAFVVYTAFVGGSMAGFADLFSQVQKTLGATQRVRELLQADPEAINMEEEPLDERYRLSGKVELDKIAFRYPSRPDIPVLKEVSLQVERGQQIALVGPSGAGKSTLAALLLRFYEPDSGFLAFDDRPAREIPLSQLRKQMALVPQDILLFGGTIRENIAYGKPSASPAEIEHAARQAHAHEFISGFPEGYDTVVGDRGIKLSGGQRQRIAIARAILKDPVILLLDEATSSLDSASELLVQAALDNLMKNRTSFVIAHRLSTIRHADKIIVLEKGLVKEMGTHQELLVQDDGLYRSLVRLQMEGGSRSMTENL